MQRDMEVATSMPNLQATDATETENVSSKVAVLESEPASPRVVSSQNTTYNKACTFFAKGTCRNGDACRFSHSTQPSPSTTSSSRPVEITQPPATILINLPPGHPVYSIDVECVATGVQHNARSIAQVKIDLIMLLNVQRNEQLVATKQIVHMIACTILLVILVILTKVEYVIYISI
jgi:hypothetical protein